MTDDAKLADKLDLAIIELAHSVADGDWAIVFSLLLFLESEYEFPA